MTRDDPTRAEENPERPPRVPDNAIGLDAPFAAAGKEGDNSDLIQQFTMHTTTLDEGDLLRITDQFGCEYIMEIEEVYPLKDSRSPNGHPNVVYVKGTSRKLSAQPAQPTMEVKKHARS
jgi:hypothetical protein